MLPPASERRHVTAQLPNSLLSEVILHENYALIHKVHLFNGVSQGFVNSLVLKMQPEVCLPGDYIFRCGEIGTSMYFVQQGTLSVMVDDADATVLNVLHAGSYFGEISLLYSGTRTRRSPRATATGRRSRPTSSTARSCRGRAPPRT